MMGLIQKDKFEQDLMWAPALGFKKLREPAAVVHVNKTQGF